MIETETLTIAHQEMQHGIAAYQMGQSETAIQALTDATIHFRLVREYALAGESQSFLATIQQESGLPDQALASYKKAIQMYQEIQDSSKEAESWMACGDLARQTGNTQRATEYYDTAWHLYTTLHAEKELGKVLLARGRIAVQEENPIKAREAYQQARVYFEQAQTFHELLNCWKSIGDVESSLFQYDDAEEAFAHALALSEGQQDMFGTIDIRISSAKNILRQGKWQEAEEAFAAVAEQAQTIEYDLGIADALLGMAQTTLFSGKTDNGVVPAEQAMKKYQELHDGLGTAEASRTIGEIELRRGHLNYARLLLERAERLFTHQKRLQEVVRSLEATIRIQILQGELEAARGTSKKAMTIAQTLQNQAEIDVISLLQWCIEQEQGIHVENEREADSVVSLKNIIADTASLSGDKAVAVHVEALLYMAEYMLRTGNIGMTVRYQEQCTDLQKLLPESSHLHAATLLIQGTMYLHIGAINTAEQIYQQVLQFAEQYSYPYIRLEAERHMTTIHLMRGEKQHALELCDVLLTKARRYGSFREEAYALLGKAVLALAEGNGETAGLLRNEAIHSGVLSHPYQVVMEECSVMHMIAHHARDFETAQIWIQKMEDVAIQHSDIWGILEAETALPALFLEQKKYEDALKAVQKVIDTIEYTGVTIENAQQRETFYHSCINTYVQAILIAANLDKEETAVSCYRAYTQHCAGEDMRNQLQQHIQSAQSANDGSQKQVVPILQWILQGE